METEIKITAHVDAAGTNCRFVIDQPVYPQGSIYFANKEKTKGAPLAEKLFELGFVTGTRIAGTEVTVTTNDRVDWRTHARKIADLIRAQIRSGIPAVPPDFKLTNLPDSELRKMVQQIFDSEINPAVASHGGFVNLVDVKDRKVYLKMGGGCQGCGQADATLRQGIEVTIRERVPEIEDILDVTDHAGGTNPYFVSAAG